MSATFLAEDEAGQSRSASHLVFPRFVLLSEIDAGQEDGLQNVYAVIRCHRR